MMNDLKNWIISIVTIIIFSTLADILLPKGNLKKLSKLVIGLIVIIVIMNPVFLLINHQQDVSGNINNYLNSFNKQSTSLPENDIYNKNTLKLFKDNLISTITNEIQIDCHKKYRIINLIVNEDINSKSFLNIETVTLSPDDRVISVKRVKKVDIMKINDTSDEFFDTAVAKVLQQKFKIDKSNIKFVR